MLNGEEQYGSEMIEDTFENPPKNYYILSFKIIKLHEISDFHINNINNENAGENGPEYGNEDEGDSSSTESEFVGNLKNVHKYIDMDDSGYNNVIGGTGKITIYVNILDMRRVAFPNTTRQKMTAVLRTRTYLNFKVSDNDKDVNDYFREVEAQYWQLKHYLNHRLENENVIRPWTEIYEDWRKSLEIIKKNKYRKIPDCVCALCNDLLDISETFEGDSVLQSCKRWYNTFYDRNFDFQLAERGQELETSIMQQEERAFSSQKKSELFYKVTNKLNQSDDIGKSDH
ncbi:12333_t:CDS:2, partial [Funneliformis geosporum]